MIDSFIIIYIYYYLSNLYMPKQQKYGSEDNVTRAKFSKRNNVQTALTQVQMDKFVKKTRNNVKKTRNNAKSVSLRRKNNKTRSKRKKKGTGPYSLQRVDGNGRPIGWVPAPPSGPPPSVGGKRRRTRKKRKRRRTRKKRVKRRRRTRRRR
jgi:hypothetical protein